MLRDIGQDVLGNIAEYASMGRVRDVNALGIYDRTLLLRIKQYNKDFSYTAWRKDLENKKNHINLVGVKYYNKVGNYEFIVNKPDDIASILSTPDTLEEYLNRLIRYEKHKYRKYFELMTGNWSIIASVMPYESDLIITDSTLDLYNALDLHNTSKTIIQSTNTIALYPLDTEDKKEMDELYSGLLDIIDIVYPIRE